MRVCVCGIYFAAASGSNNIANIHRNNRIPMKTIMKAEKEEKCNIKQAATEVGRRRSAHTYTHMFGRVYRRTSVCSAMN